MSGIAIASRLLAAALFVVSSSAQALVCDVDNNNVIDRTDITAITAALGLTVAAGDPRDANGDLIVTVLDARACALRCTLPNCAIPGANNPPVANPDGYSTPRDVLLNVPAPGVLGNDTDTEGSPLTAQVVTGPVGGTLLLSANGSFTYSPAPGFAGQVTFTYVANDGAANSAPAMVTIDVLPTNRDPVAVADDYQATEDQTLNVGAPGVLANDTDPDGNTLAAGLVQGPASGQLTLFPDGSFTYAPTANFAGDVTFSYSASDGSLVSNVAVVTIHVQPANDVPVANTDAYSTPEDNTLNVAAPGVLGNDSDVEGSPLTAVLETPPASGLLTLNPDGSFSYAPTPNDTTPRSFTYRASDGVAQSSPATVTITVVPSNDAPVALDDTYSTPADQTLAIVPPGVLANDVDLEGSPLTAAVVQGTASGSLNLSASGGFTYAPNTGFSGTDTFTYRANDGFADSNTATVTINVTAANLPVVSVSASTPGASEAGPVNGAFTLIRAGDTSASLAVSIGITGTAADGSDFQTIATTQTMSPGQPTLLVPVNVLRDNLVESSESVILTIQPSALYSIGSGPATVNIADDPAVVSVVASTPNASETGPVHGAFTLSRAGGNIAAALPVAIAMSGGAANGTDYATIGSPQTIPAGQASVIVPVTVQPDAFAEGSETAILTIQPSSSYAIGTNPATVTIADDVAGTITLSLANPLIAVGGTTGGTITLSPAAPAGGLVVQLAGVAGVTSVAPPSMNIPAGNTGGVFTVTGLGLGSGPITGTAPGYSQGSVNVTVTSNVITVGNVTVAPGAQAGFPVTLSTPAPAGGLTVNLSSSAPGIATVPASVFIPAGQSTASPNPLATGVAFGTATITGSGAGYAPGNGTATVALSASFSPNPLAVVQNGTAQITLTLAANAPAGGVSVNLAMDNPAMAGVPATAQIPAGLNSVQITVTGGSTLGSTTLRATGVAIAPTSATINVTQAPAINVGNATVGRNLQVQSSFTLAAPAPAGNLVVTLTSSDPARLLLSTTSTGAGQPSITVTIGAGSSNGNFIAQALVDNGTATVTATAAAYATGVGTITFAPSGLYIGMGDFTTGVASANRALIVCSARLNPGTLARGPSQQLRGGLSVDAALSSSNPAVGTIVNSPTPLAGGENCTPGSGALQFDPIGLGTSTLTLAQPAGFSTPASEQSIVATVGAPITVNGQSVGKDLQVQANIQLGAPAPAGNLVVTLTSADPARLLLATTAAAAGAASITVSIAAGSSNGIYFAQALASTGTVDVTATAPAYADGTATFTLQNSGFYINSPGNFDTGPTSVDTGLVVCAARLQPNGQISTTQQLRGGHSVSIAMTSSNPAVGMIAGTPFALTGGNSCTPNSGGLAFDPAALGTSTLALVQPAGFTVPTNGNQSIIATVGAAIVPNPATIGKDLQLQSSFSLGAPAPAGNLQVTLTSSDPSRLLLSPNATTPGAASIVVQVNAGSSSFIYHLQSLVDSGTTTYTATAPAYTAGTATVTHVPSGFYIGSPSNFTTNTLDPNTTIQLCVGRLNPGTLTVLQNGTLRIGIAPVNLAVSSSNNLVGTIVNSPRTLGGNENCTDSSGAARMQFDPVGVGTTTLTLTPTPPGFSTPSVFQSIVATVTASGINVNAATVGKDLQVGANGSLQSAATTAVDVVLTSTDPARLLLAPNATSAGAASITIPVAAGASSFSYTLQALDGTGTVQVTAAATGYSGGAGTMTLVPSGFIINTPSNFTTNTLDPNTTMQLCAGRLTPGTLNYAGPGTLRIGVTPVSLAVTSSAPGVGTIVNTPQALAGNQSCTPSTGTARMQFDPIGVGTSTLTLTPTPPGFSTPSNLQSVVATVTASGINVNAATVGKDLQVATSGSLQSAAPAGGVDVLLTSADPARLLLAPNATTAGSASLTVHVNGGATGFGYTIQGLADTGTVEVTASAPGFASGAGTMTFVPSGFIINTPGNFTTNTLDPNTDVQLCAARLQPTTLNYVTTGTLRFGITPVSLAVTSSIPAVGAVVNSPQPLAGNQNCTSTAAGGMEFDPAAAGVTVLALTPTPGFSTPSNFVTATATVVPSGITVNPQTLGKDLQTNANGSLQSPAPAGGIVVTLTSANPARLLLAPNATTAGTPSITVNVAAGATSFSYTVQALDGTGTEQVTASAPAFANGTGTMTLHPSGFIIDSPSSINTTVAGANVVLRVCAARLSPTTLNWAASGTLRFGITPVNLAATSSNVGVGTIVNSPQALAGNQQCTPPSGAAAMAFDPVGAGTSTLTLTPTPPGFSTPSNFQTINATVN